MLGSKTLPETPQDLTGPVTLLDFPGHEQLGLQQSQYLVVLPVPEKPPGIVSKSPDELVEVGMDELPVEEDVDDEEDDEVDENVISSGTHWKYQSFK